MAEPCEEFIRIIETVDHKIGFTYMSTCEIGKLMTRNYHEYTLKGICAEVYITSRFSFCSGQTRYTLVLCALNEVSYIRAENIDLDKFLYTLYYGSKRKAPRWIIKYVDGQPVHIDDNDMMAKCASANRSEIDAYIDQYIELDL